MADVVCASLEAEKIHCWVAPQDALTGQSSGEAIVDAINNCRVMVVILSAHSNNSPQVSRV